MDWYLTWFETWQREGGTFVPEAPRTEAEPALQHQQLRQVLSERFSVNLDAFVPVEEQLADLDPARLVPPQRCLQVISDVLREAAAGEVHRVRDESGQPVPLEGPVVAAWIAGYQSHWRAGRHGVRSTR